MSRNPNFNSGSGKASATAAPVTLDSKPSKLTPNPASAALAAANAAANAPANAETKITHEMIAMAAYLRWQRMGGDAHTNWVEAEKELRAKQR
jgi:hypothetical protein